jgi:hypothetical protein
MLRTLPTKEIKVFHSSSGVGIAYMVLGLLERKNRDFFHQVTLVVEGPVTSKFEAKWQFRTLLGAFPGQNPSPKLLDILYFFLLRLMIGALRAGVKHIANFAVSA